MAMNKKIKIKDLPPDQKVSQEELDHVTGGAGLTQRDLNWAGANLTGRVAGLHPRGPSSALVSIGPRPQPR